MTTIDRKRLSRGVKLTVEHVFDPVSSVAVAVGMGSGISTENLRLRRSRFHVAINVPRLDADMFANTPGRTNNLSFPFTLPPFQRNVNILGRVDSERVMYVLEAVGVSFDQRAEPAAIEWDTGGVLLYDSLDALDISISVVEKRQLPFGGTTDPEAELFSARLKPAAFADKDRRLNPFAWSGLSKQINPFRTYAVLVNAEKLLSTNNISGKNCELPSFQITLTFSAELTLRSTSSDNVQNMPSHNGLRSSPLVAPNVPASQSDIYADGAKGVSTNLDAVDQLLRERLVGGGYRQDGSLPLKEALTDPAAYEVIAVPMMGGFSSDTVWYASNAYAFPYGGVAPYPGPCGDMRRIPINGPLIVHHVIAAFNYQANLFGPHGGNPPGNGVGGDFHAKIGVGIVTIADQIAAQQVAWLDLTPANRNNYTIDRFRPEQTTVYAAGDRAWDLVQVPLVNNGNPGKGLLSYGTGSAISQGTPFFVGRGTSLTRGRSNAADYLNNSVSPVTKGAEQFIEIRWAISNSGGLSGPGVAPAGGALTDYDVYAGHGGNVVYLICEKNLSGLSRALSMGQQQALNP